MFIGHLVTIYYPHASDIYNSPMITFIKFKVKLATEM